MNGYELAIERSIRRHNLKRKKVKYMTFLQGKKTYLVCLATLIYAGLGFYLKFLTPTDAIQTALAALGAAGFRSAMNK